jgi:hypothetical protein
MNRKMLLAAAAVSVLCVVALGQRPERPTLRPLYFSEGGGYAWVGVFVMEDVGGRRAVFLADPRQWQKRIRINDSWANFIIEHWDEYKGRHAEGSSHKDAEPLDFYFLRDPKE